MLKSKNRAWIARHIQDPFVQKAQKEGYRSRASYKLLALHQKDKLFRKGHCVVDLGGAPGGWAQVVSELVGTQGKVVALDKLPIAPIQGVIALEADFTEETSLQLLASHLGNTQPDWVLSDMAPDLSGCRAIDQPAAMYLAELALEFAKTSLKPGGGFLVKVFHGEGFEDYLKLLRKDFETVVTRKPAASRSTSRECYLLAKGYNI